VIRHERAGLALRVLVAAVCVIAGVVSAQDQPGATSMPTERHPAVEAALQENGELARRANDPDGLAARAWTARDEATAATEDYAVLRAACVKLERAIATSGLTNTVRILLRRLRSDLPDLHKHRRKVVTVEQELDAVQLQMLDYEHRRDALDDIEAHLRDEMSALSPPVVPPERPIVETALREQLITRRDLLDTLINDAHNCYAQLAHLAEVERQIVDETRRARSWIDGSSLWLRDAVPLGLTGMGLLLSDGVDAVEWLVRPSNWVGLGRALWNDTIGNPTAALFTLLLIMLLLRQRPRIAVRLRETADSVDSLKRDRFRPTAEAFGLTLVQAGLMPAVLMLLSWRLQASAGSAGFTMSVAVGLQTTAWLALALNSLSEICRPRGLGEAHLLWPENVSASLRRHVGMLVGVVLPATFVVSTLLEHGRDPWSESLGRAIFMLGCVVLALVLRHMLRPRGKVMIYFAQRNRESWLIRARVLWVVPLVVLPLLLAALSAMGYFSTALKLQVRVQSTVWLIVGLVVVHALLLRWVFIARRRLAVMIARRKAEAAARASSAGEAAEDASAKSEDLDLVSLNAQTRRIVAAALVVVMFVGGWLIWRDVLVGLNVLDRVSLWSHQVESVAEKLGPDGQVVLDVDGLPQTESRTTTVPVTLADVMLMVLLAVMTYVAARNIPGLLQISILQRLPLDPGSLYAITTLTRYLIVIVGIVAVFGSIGIGWGEVQWLAAAVTVGLGFGLQEIFANFVSGIILLMERPIRVGDTVTVVGVRAQQGVHQQPARELDARRFDPAGDRQGGHRLRQRHQAGHETALRGGREEPQGARRALAARRLPGIRGQYAELRGALLRGRSRDRAPDPARDEHGHRRGLPRGRHRDRIPAARHPHPQRDAGPALGHDGEEQAGLMSAVCDGLLPPTSGGRPDALPSPRRRCRGRWRWGARRTRARRPRRRGLRWTP
jgi:potassium efflux system protein